MAAVSVLSMHLLFPGCTSLKEKRSRLKPLLARLHREFNLSAAEVDFQDSWQNALIACALVSNDSRFNQSALEKVTAWVEQHWPDVEVVDNHIERIL